MAVGECDVYGYSEAAVASLRHFEGRRADRSTRLAKVRVQVECDLLDLQPPPLSTLNRQSQSRVSLYEFHPPEPRLKPKLEERVKCPGVQWAST